MAHTPFEPTIAGAQAPPPYDCRGVKVFGFPLLADVQPLQDLCDQFLGMASASAGISFEPIVVAPNTCSVVVEVLDYQSLKPTTPPWDDLGEIPQQELLFAVPVTRKHEGLPVDVGIFIPYIFVDDQGSAFAGREVLGLPKILASFSVDPNFPASPPLVVRLRGRKTVGGPIQLAQLVKVEAPPFALGPPSADIRIDRFFGPLDLFADFDAFGLIEDGHTTGSVFGFSSRILIDPASPLMDAHQSIMRCTYASTNKATGLLPSPMTVTLKRFVHLDIGSTLGIRSNAAGEILSINPYFLDADFSLEGVMTLWES